MSESVVELTKELMKDSPCLCLLLFDDQPNGPRFGPLCKRCDTIEQLEEIIDAHECKAHSHLPDELISFNPSDPESIDKIHGKFGPEGLYEIGRVLQKIAMDDVDGAIAEAQS